MSASSSSLFIYSPVSDSDRPQKMHHCDEQNGLLSDIQYDDECLIATIQGRKVVLPEELFERLQPMLDKRIGLVRFDDEFYLRELS
jgi:hypothetical protein